MPESISSSVNTTNNGLIVLQDMPPIRDEPDVLHFEVVTDRRQQGYFNLNDVGAKLTAGGILKLIVMRRSNSCIFSVFKETNLLFLFSTILNIIHRYSNV